jgi:hypothetical protein
LHRLFRSAPRFAAFSPIFLQPSPLFSSGIAAQTLRKKARTRQCAKDAEKARKICGIAVENVVEFLSRSGG